MPNGPLVNGVTFVFAVVAAIPAKVSFVKALTAVTATAFVDATVSVRRLHHQLVCSYNCLAVCCILIRWCCSTAT
jgi:hypothetical protein